MSGLRILKSHCAYTVTLKVMVWLFMATMDSGRARWDLILKQGRPLSLAFPYTALVPGERPGRGSEISRWVIMTRQTTEAGRILSYRIASSGIWQDMSRNWPKTLLWGCNITWGRC